ncbi:unnamed protein product [marine sediment metagenome]|uniref:Shikimate kinase n=1 Tax=marine sediment metagenome TaxID=412755 RepID=X1BFH2_9ZZZZ
MIIFLIGFMGSGKSTTGKQLAKRLGYTFVDTDNLIVERLGMSVNEIFDRLGEKTFRKNETRLLNELILKNNLVVSTGGGLPCYGNNMDAATAFLPAWDFPGFPDETVFSTEEDFICFPELSALFPEEDLVDFTEVSVLFPGEDLVDFTGVSELFPDEDLVDFTEVSVLFPGEDLVDFTGVSALFWGADVAASPGFSPTRDSPDPASDSNPSIGKISFTTSTW